MTYTYPDFPMFVRVCDADAWHEVSVCDGRYKREPPASAS
jgi:hypothetical protein